MENQEGLVDGGIYTITCVGDGSVATLDGNKVVTNQKSDDPEIAKLQVFECNITDNDTGNFSISSVHQNTGKKMVWDFLPHRRLLIQEEQRQGARSNQQWSSQNVPSLAASYYLLKAPEGTHCLFGKGIGNQIQIVEKTSEVTASPNAYWKLDSVQPNLNKTLPNSRTEEKKEKSRRASKIRCSLQ